MSTFLSLISRLKDYSRYVYASIICYVLMAVFTVASIPMIIPFFQILFEREAPKRVESGNVIDQAKNIFIDILQTYDKETALIFVCIGIAGAIFLKNLFRYMARYYITPVRNGIVRDIRSGLFDKYMSLPTDYFTDEKKGTLITKMTADVMEVEMSILQFVQAIFKDPLLIIGSIGFMLYIHPGLTVFVFILMIVSGLVISTISRKLKHQSKDVQESLGHITSIVDESITGMPVIKAYNVESVWKEKFEHYNNKYRGMMTALLRRKDLSSPMSEVLGVGVVIIVLYYGSHLVFKSQISPEVFFAFIFAFYNVIEPSKSLSNTYFNVQKGMAAAERIEQIMEEADEQDSTSSGSVTFDFSKEIRFEQMSFKYPNSDDYALRDIDLTIQKGEKIALVGASGSGKSTFTKLLLKFYHPTAGSIHIDNQSIVDIPNQEVRKQIGWVTQDAFLYNASVGDNIRFGRDQFDQEEVKAAAAKAFADQFIQGNPDGYQANVGERGNKFSGGEKQRISISRALLSNPPIILLDEPTSALDPEAERRVTEALRTAMEGRTSIVIAHRMSTIMYADRIIVLDQGRIVGIGNHEELLESSEIYAHYISLQTKSD